MHYHDASHLHHESVRYQSCIHWVLVLRPLVMMTIALMGVFWLALDGHFFNFVVIPPFAMWTPGTVTSMPGSLWVSILAVLSVLIFAHAAVHAIARRATTDYIVTNRRIIAKWGWISRNTYEISTDRIEGAHIRQDFLGRILGYGTILIHGVGGGTVAFKLVTNPVEFRVAVAEAIDDPMVSELKSLRTD